MITRHPLRKCSIRQPYKLENQIEKSYNINIYKSKRLSNEFHTDSINNYLSVRKTLQNTNIHLGVGNPFI